MLLPLIRICSPPLLLLLVLAIGVPPIRVRVALPASTQEAFRLADQAFSLLGARVRRALEQALGLAQQATEPAARAGALSTLVLAEATLVAHALVLTALAHTLSLIIAPLGALILTITPLGALILTEAALTTLAALILIVATLSALVLIVAALVLTRAALILAAALGVLLVAIVGGLGCVVSLVV